MWSMYNLQDGESYVCKTSMLRGSSVSQSCVLQCWPQSWLQELRIEGHMQIDDCGARKLLKIS